MQSLGTWKSKELTVRPMSVETEADGTTTKTGGRGRSRKRSALYNSLAMYHNHFLELLTQEYKAEVSACKTRRRASWSLVSRENIEISDVGQMARFG